MKLLTLSRKPIRATDMSERQQRLIWRVAALLLDYPSAEAIALADEIGAAAEELPEQARAWVRDFLTYFRGTEALRLAAAYVETFDMRRRASLHLTYYAYGDTRKRGMALLRFKHAYRHAGLEFGDGELPDYLPMLLEFAAAVDPLQGERLLTEHVPVLELLRLSLHDNGSPYANLLAAILSTLPPISVADRRRIAELAAEGPPDEEVGLVPFAMDPLVGERR